MRADLTVWTFLIRSIKCKCFGGPSQRISVFLPPAGRVKRKTIHHDLMTVSTHKYLTCVAREKTRGREERDTVTIHYLLLPAIITSFCKLFLFPFLAPKLHSDFHFVKSNKKASPSCLRLLLLIKLLLEHSTSFHNSITVSEALAPGSC